VAITCMTRCSGYIEALHNVSISFQRETPIDKQQQQQQQQQQQRARLEVLHVKMLHEQGRTNSIFTANVTMVTFAKILPFTIIKKFLGVTVFAK